jgi:hypothetical protein
MHHSVTLFNLFRERREKALVLGRPRNNRLFRGRRGE